MFRFVLVVAFAALAKASLYLPPQLPILDGRIVGGVNTTIEEYPYQLALELNERRHCGASLIKPNVALTAAHCTYGRSPNSFRIRGGSTYHGIAGELADVIKICDHPKYNPYDYDVSVLLLNRSLPLSASIQTIFLQPVGIEVPEGTVATVTGWGRLFSGGDLPLTLQKVEVPRISQETCASNYPLKTISERMDCYGYPEGGKDACQGDSGGPLVVNGKQTGIVSWGRGCAKPRKPGVYAKVSNKEIIDHIHNCIANF